MMDYSPPPRRGGIYSALRYTGIPPSWLEKRPKLPSRNWLIFLSAVTALTALYVDDQRKCRKIREEYAAKVRHLAEEPLGSMDWGRKVTVYSCRYPEDHDHERSMKYFKRYVKPVFVAAALDFEIINGNHYGAMTNKVAEDIKKKRREALGLEKSHDEILNSFLPLKGDRSPTAKARRELEGGIVVVGRHSLKEYLTGLKRGWSESLQKSDPEEELAQSLSQDIFDEPAPISQDLEIKGDADTTQPPASTSPNVLSPLPQNGKPHGLFGPLRQQPTPSTFHRSFVEDQPPAVIPLQPPIGLIPFTNHIGFMQIPYMIYDFFTERNRVLSGCKAGYAIVMAQSRPFTPNDLDFDVQSERYTKGSWLKLPKRIAKSKDQYYKELKDKIKTARELAYGEREPTRSEKANPPMSEVELRNERLKKEMKWKEDLEGWEVLKGQVPWDERFEGNLRVFVEPDA
ncbi:hypothetical protein CPB86DRAFT_803660 [Serendipita vermifera]|nr:hypothetical protein CPB86DRAFT_803660 [Serendipita vermifera]